MSNRAVNWARKVPDLRPTEAFVLWVICDRYNEEVGMAWPSIATIARETRYSDRTVSRALKRLDELGVIKIKKTYSNRHDGWVSNTYLLPELGAEDYLLEADVLQQFWGPNNSRTGFREVIDL